MKRRALFLLFALSFLLPASQASAFCGFYVSGAGAKMYNDATMVVMMREGTQTVLSMRNNYQGPPQDFAMVVPVPVVLQKDQVKTLDDTLFERVDKLASPRLVEYWEENPCPKRVSYGVGIGDFGGSGGNLSLQSLSRGYGGPSVVQVEAQFKVGEYDIVILSATESTGLEAWLKQHKYNIPKGASAELQSYIAQGQYFFVAKVDTQKVKFSKRGRAMLSPLRFHYTSQSFSLPIRLGLLNAKGKQDLLVHILAKNQRYDVANYPNLTIPTNLVVSSYIRKRFTNFYTSMIDAVLEANPKSVLTEYSWNAGKCDPCPVSALTTKELLSLGADVFTQKTPLKKLPSHIRPDRFRTKKQYMQAKTAWERRERKRRRAMARGRGGNNVRRAWTLTRLHARYAPGEISEDLVFKKAPALIGGGGMPQGVEGVMDQDTQTVEHGQNSFQGRYIILNRWRKKLTCKNPERGIWGYPPREKIKVSPQTSRSKRKLRNPGKFIVRGAPSYLK